MSSDVLCDFPVGCLVVVESRTWAGINKPGGTGHVLKVYNDAEGTPRVDVKYVLTGTEKNIELEWVKKQEFLGRCSRSRKKDAPFIREQSERVPKRNTKKQRKVVKTPKKPTSIKKKRKLNTEVIELTSDSEEKGAKSKPKEKDAKLKEINRADDEKIDTSIPREITIVSCCSSTGSLSFQENLANASKFYSKKSNILHRGRKNKKALEEQAKNNRKMTEYFTLTTTPVTDSNNDKKRKSFTIHNDVSTPRATKEKCQDGNDYNGEATSTPKVSTVNYGKKHHTTDTHLSRKTNINPTTSRRPLLPHNVNSSCTPINEHQSKVTGASTAPVTYAKKKLVEKNMNSKSTIPDVSAPVADTKQQTPIVEEDNPVKKERLDIFTSLFSHLISQEIESAIQIHDLITKINSRMLVKTKFEYDEAVLLVKKLDENGRVMYNTDDEVIYII